MTEGCQISLSVNCHCEAPMGLWQSHKQEQPFSKAPFGKGSCLGDRAETEELYPLTERSEKPFKKPSSRTHPYGSISPLP